MGKYPGIVLGESTDYLRLMQGTVYKTIGVLEYGVYKPDEIHGEITHYYDYLEEVNEETTVQDLLKNPRPCYGFAWEEPMLHRFMSSHKHPQLIDGYYFEASLPYSFLLKPTDYEIRFQLLRAKNDLRRSNKAFVVTFHT